MRQCIANLSIATGNRGHVSIGQVPVENYATSQSIDNDADTFSIQLGNVDGALAACFERDNEIRARLYLTDTKSNPHPIFTGLADVAVLQEDMTAPIVGRDVPSVLADSDALPGRWRHTRPNEFIAARAHRLGITRTQIATMKRMTEFFTDGSEKDWALWYRLARVRDMYMWTDNLGGLIVDKLGYTLRPSYYIGEPSNKYKSAKWIHCEPTTTLTSTKQTRIRKVIVYGTDAKKGQTKVAQAKDTHIGAWLKQTVEVYSSTKHRSLAELQKVAQAEVFEGIVGAQEFVVTVRDADVAIEQNTMVIINMPEYGFNNELMYVVGVDRNGDSSTSCTQIVRLREKGFAVTQRVPDAPTISKGSLGSDLNKPATSIGEALSNTADIRWGDSFVRATHTYGKQWDFAVFCGVLLAICHHESRFLNIREQKAGATGNGEEWQPFNKWVNSGPRLTEKKSELELELEWKKTFANDGKNPLNPFHTRTSDANAGVGPMQLTTSEFKVWADQFGFQGKPVIGEYIGGRWNPDSNILAGARALAGKLAQSPPADPTNGDSIWIGVGRYAGGSEEAQQAYINAIKALFKTTYLKAATAALAAVKTLPPGTATDINIPGHGPLVIPKNTPGPVKKSINWALQHLGDPYRWGGYGPNYDCSSLVTAALAHGSTEMRNKLDPPNQAAKHHGDNTYTLFKRGRFKSISKDSLLPGDLVFFLGTADAPDHVGMYLGEGFFIEDPRPGKYVDIQSLSDTYWTANYRGARRIADWPKGSE